ncbi:MAG: hypothetical protein AB1330_11890 [Bacillota bacterium]
MEQKTQGRVIELTISSTVAGDYTHRFAVKEPIGAVKRQALAHFKMDPAMADKYILLWNGSALNDNITLEDAEIPDRAMLLLEPRQPEVI